MKITEKINMGYDQLVKNGPITIVAFGDSVTHGSVVGPRQFYDTVYHNRLKNMIYEVRDYVPVNVINAGIGGVTASQSIARTDTQVTSHNPDLVIVCFGLNDVNEPLETFINSLKIIFEKCLACGADVIYMTPNMLNDHVAEGTEPQYLEYAHTTAKIQTDGTMDKYMDEAMSLARKMGVTVCDCYGEWKKLAKTQDITLLLANRINHPTVQMHELFARMLFNTIFSDCDEIDKTPVSTMFGGM
jgi:lysophospholipase L1-like esterase